MKHIFTITLLFACFVTSAQQKFDHTVLNNTKAVVVYKLVFDSADKSATLMATNIYCNEEGFPLANKGLGRRFFEKIAHEEPSLRERCDKITALIGNSDTSNLLEYFFTSRSPVVGSSVSEQINYNFEEDLYKKESIKHRENGIFEFYVAIKIHADLLFVFEVTKPVYMKQLSCPDSYDVVKDELGPSVIILNCYGAKHLSRKEKIHFGLSNLHTFSYQFYYCD